MLYEVITYLDLSLRLLDEFLPARLPPRLDFPVKRTAEASQNLRDALGRTDAAEGRGDGRPCLADARDVDVVLV